MWTETGGIVAEPETRQGHSQGGGTAGVTGMEKNTGFNLSTDTESDLSQIWRIKNFSQLLNTL